MTRDLHDSQLATSSAESFDATSTAAARTTTARDAPRATTRARARNAHVDAGGAGGGGVHGVLKRIKAREGHVDNH